MNRFQKRNVAIATGWQKMVKAKATKKPVAKKVTKKATTKKDKIVAIDFDWTKVGENVQKNAEEISANIIKNAETIGNNIAKNSKAVGDRMSAYLNRNL